MTGKNSVLKVFAALIGAVLVTGGFTTADAADPKRGIHKRLFAVPCAGEVEIDGKLDDWDLSGQISSYISEDTKEQKNGRMAMMYDDEALYIGARVQDPTPLMNRHDPEANPDKVWNADSIQVRLVIDREEGYPATYSKYDKNKYGDEVIQHLLLWYYTDGGNAWLQLRKDMSYTVPEKYKPHGLVSHDDFEGAYRKGEDGESYVMEYRIPWETLDAENHPKAGDIVAGTIQYNFSRPDGLKIDSGKGAWARDVVSGGGFPFQSSSCWGKFIFAEKGNVPQVKVAGKKEAERPEPLKFSYNLPEDGVVNISLWDDDNTLVRNVVCAEKREAGKQTEEWDGLDYRGKPIDEGEYTWQGIYHEPITTDFLLSVHNSGTPPYKTADGTGGWGADHTNPSTAEALGDQMLLGWPFGESGWGIIRVALKGDKKAGSGRGNAKYMAADEKGNRVFAANPGHFSGVRVFTAEEFKPINLAGGRGKPEIPDGGDEESNEVSGLVYNQGKLYVAYAERDLITVNNGRNGKLMKTMKVPGPGRLAVAADDTILTISGENVYKVEKGAITVLAKSHLADPQGIATDWDGRIYVTNRGDLQNVSVFNKNGEYVKSIGKEGGRPRVGRYDPSGMLQPAGCAIDAEGCLWVAEHIDGPKRISVWNTQTGENVDEFFGGSSYSTWVDMDPKHPDEVYCHNVLWKVDLDKGTKKPYSTLWRSKGENSPAGPPSGSSHGGGFSFFTAENGRQYGYARHRILYLRDGPIFKPVLEFREDKVWIDQNDNQRRDEGEFQTSEMLKKRGGGFQWVDKHLNLYNSRTGRIWKPERFREDGVPVYDFSDPAEMPFRSWNPQGPTMFVDSRNGDLYKNAAVRDRSKIGFGRWSAEGEMHWGIRGTLFWKSTLEMGNPEKGDLYALTAPLGVAGNFTGAATYFSGYHLLTRQGDYVNMIMNPPANEGLGPQKVMCELFTGRLVQTKGENDQGRYLLLTGDQDGRVMQVNGLDTVERMDGGTWKMTEEKVAKVEEAQRKYKKAKSRSQTLVVFRGRDQLENVNPVGSSLKGGMAFKARAARDEENLYLRYNVTAPSPLVNSVADPETMFTGGNCLDLQIATNPDAPGEREKPAPGDVRVLITQEEKNGKMATRAVLYEPNVKGFDGDPTVFESPVDEESFDRIKEVSDRVEVKTEETEGGVVATATIPLDLLGWQPTAGMGVKMDLGYVFGNKTGTNALKRAYWTNDSFEANVVDDIPDESRLNPEYWGKAVVE